MPNLNQQARSELSHLLDELEYVQGRRRSIEKFVFGEELVLLDIRDQQIQKIKFHALRTYELALESEIDNWHQKQEQENATP